MARDGVRPRSLVDETRRVMRLRHYSIPTEEAYAQWIRRFIRFSGGRHPHRPASARPSQRGDHDGLYPCSKSGRTRGAKPARSGLERFKTRFTIGGLSVARFRIEKLPELLANPGARVMKSRCALHDSKSRCYDLFASLCDVDPVESPRALDPAPRRSPRPGDLRPLYVAHFGELAERATGGARRSAEGRDAACRPRAGRVGAALRGGAQLQ